MDLVLLIVGLEVLVVVAKVSLWSRELSEIVIVGFRSSGFIQDELLLVVPSNGDSLGHLLRTENVVSRLLRGVGIVSCVRFDEEIRVGEDEEDG